MSPRIRTRLTAVAGSFAALALATSTLPGTASASDGPSASAGGGAESVTVPELAGPICGWNNESPNGDSITAQKFEREYKDSNTWGAADFQLDAKCRVRRVIVPGSFGGSPGPADKITISFHENSPASAAKCLTTQPGPGPNFTVHVSGCKLKPFKHYWLVVQVKQNYSTAGQWYWRTTDGRLGAHDQWQNPGDGFGTGCTIWGTTDSCIGLAYDYLFTVYRQ